MVATARRDEPIPYYAGFRSGDVAIDPVSFHSDNGGNQHASMRALYQNPNAPMSPGELIAFASVMNGKRDFGGLDGVTGMMQLADKMNAYAAQSQVSDKVLEMLSSGYTPEEARYAALSDQLLDNGHQRAAISLTIPEYGKYADERAKRDLDFAYATGADYSNRGLRGYTPLGITGMTRNADGTTDFTLSGGRTATNVPDIHAGIGVYGAIKGGGAGTKGVTEYHVSQEADRVKRAEKMAENELELLKIQLGLTGNGNRLSLPEFYKRKLIEKELAVDKEKEKHKLKQGGSKSGNTTGTPSITADMY